MVRGSDTDYVLGRSSDGDGVGDNADAFPNDATRSEYTVKSDTGSDQETAGGPLDFVVLLLLTALVPFRRMMNIN